MSDIFKCVEKLLNDNGVRVDVEELQLNHPDDDMRCVRIEKKILTLDFTEHDKVFEDKIELLNRNLDLQKDKRCEAEIERNYLAERINQLEGEITSLESHMSRLRERCMDGARRHFDNGIYGCLTIVKYPNEFEAENMKLKQQVKEYKDKIARLEENVEYYKDSLSRTENNCDKLYHENKELKQRIAELEDKIGDRDEINRCLREQIAELESKETSDLPFDPLECANYLINATYERETNGIERTFHNLPDKVNSDRYTVDKLEQIAEHLLVYCKHNKETEWPPNASTSRNRHLKMRSGKMYGRKEKKRIWAFYTT